MEIAAHHIRDIIAELANSDVKRREGAADGVTDWIPGLDPSFALILSRTLEVVMSLEDSEGALEAQLHAFQELAASSLAPHDVVERVIASRTWESPWAIDYIDGLKEDLSIAPR